ncbi:DUF1045 domain-containing protein [Rhodobacterales bacterium HKCCE4037]|nr:DUF1045 domain-containing protein [Rhodobacterales bacterium HKCCE4037]
MDKFRRYGIYVVPTGTLFEVGSAWLGWDSVAGVFVAQPDLDGLAEPVEALTRTPRKYGLHGTIKPPFALVDGQDFTALQEATGAFCAAQAPVEIPKLTVQRLGGFVALVPETPSAELAALAAAAVRSLDRFRAAPTSAELDRRRRAGLTARQEAMLHRWGYPYVMDDFRFHMTLTGRTRHADAARSALAAHIAPVLPQPFVIDSLALMGEDEHGRFHVLRRYALAG